MKYIELCEVKIKSIEKVTWITPPSTVDEVSGEVLVKSVCIFSLIYFQILRLSSSLLNC